MFAFISLGYNFRIASNPVLKTNSNPYLLATVIKEELYNSHDDYLAATAAANPNKRHYPCKKTLGLRKRKADAMKQFTVGNTDLATYMCIMGSLTMAMDKRIMTQGKNINNLIVVFSVLLLIFQIHFHRERHVFNAARRPTTSLNPWATRAARA